MFAKVREVRAKIRLQLPAGGGKATEKTKDEIFRRNDSARARTGDRLCVRQK